MLCLYLITWKVISTPMSDVQKPIEAEFCQWCWLFLFAFKAAAAEKQAHATAGSGHPELHDHNHTHLHAHEHVHSDSPSPAASNAQGPIGTVVHLPASPRSAPLASSCPGPRRHNLHIVKLKLWSVRLSLNPNDVTET